MNVVELPKRGPVIGGSVAAAAAGIDPHLSRVMLWAQLTGRVERRETEAMRWGTLLEPVILEELRNRGDYQPSPWGEPVEVVDRDRPWLVGRPDGIVETPDGTDLLEVKTAGAWSAKEWADGAIPLQYAAQVQTYLHLTGFRRCLVACLVGGQAMELRWVSYSGDAVARLLVLLEQFWRYVERDVPPAPDDSQSARDALAALYPRGDGSTVRLLGDDWQTYLDLVANRARRDRIDRTITGLENRLKDALGEADTALSPDDRTVIRWTNTSRTTLDTKRVRSDYPEVWDACKQTTDARRFSVL